MPMKSFETRKPLPAVRAALPVRRPQSCWLPGLALAALAASTSPAPAFTLLSSNQLVYVNVDHAPVGACSTITYGLNGPVGPYTNIRGDWCGLGMSSSEIPYWPSATHQNVAGGGVVIALSGSAGLRTLPFLLAPYSVSSNASFFPAASAQRTL